MSMHDPRLALAYGDEILILHEGSLYAHLRKENKNERAAL